MNFESWRKVLPAVAPALQEIVMRSLTAAFITTYVLASASSLSAQAGETSVVKNNVLPNDWLSVEVTPVIVAGALKTLRVETRFKGDPDGETQFNFPRAPGDQHGRPVARVRVRGGHSVRRTDDSQFVKHKPNALIRISYTLGEQPQEQFNTIIKSDFFSSPGWYLFPDLEGRDPLVRFSWGRIPKGWRVGSDLEHHAVVKGVRWMDAMRSILVGGSRLHIEERPLGDGRLRIAVTSESKLEPPFLADMAWRAARTSTRLWKDDGGDYFIGVTTLRDVRQSGLGLGDGYAVYLTADPDKYELKNTITHEHLHTWISTSFGGGPAWFREGFTEYYARAVNLRSGAYTPHEFARRWNEALARYANSPLRLAKDADANKMFFSDEDAARLGEDRGSIIAALLDYRLRNRRNTLREMLLKVKSEVEAEGYVQGRDGSTRLVEKARQLAGIDLQPDIDRHLGRGEAITLPADLFGTCATVVSIKVPKFEQGFKKGLIGKPVEGVDATSNAYAAGLRNGMIIIRREAGTPGDSRKDLAYRVKNGPEELTIRYKPVGNTLINMQEVQLIPGIDATSEQCIAGLSWIAAADLEPTN